MFSKHLRRNAPRQPAPHRPWRGLVSHFILALVLALLCHVLAEFWLRPATAPPPTCEAPLHTGAASPRCPVPLTAFAA